jgi:hypothetical protein
MNADQYMKFQMVMNELNQNQKNVALSLIKDEAKFSFSSKLGKLHIKINETGKYHNFVDYVKMVCGC